MSWEDVPQPRAGSVSAPVSVSLKPGVGGHIRLTVTISPTVVPELGWTSEERLGLRVGRGNMAGSILIAPAPHGRPLRAVPRSGYRMVNLVPPEDMARWTCPATPADHEVDRTGGVGPIALRIILPWDLSGDPPEDDAQEAA